MSSDRMDYSHQALLDMLPHIPYDFSKARTVEELVRQLSEGDYAILDTLAGEDGKVGGFMEKDEFVMALRAIEANPALMNLELVDVKYITDKNGNVAKDYGIMCLKNPETNEVTFAFPGTGGYLWHDNGDGVLKMNSHAQRQAAEYVQEKIKELAAQNRSGEPYYYSIVGHSKGGNMVTYVVCELLKNNIGLDVTGLSIDGQNLSDIYIRDLEQNHPEVLKRADEVLVNINAKNDFVNCLGGMRTLGRMVFLDKREKYVGGVISCHILCALFGTVENENGELMLGSLNGVNGHTLPEGTERGWGGKLTEYISREIMALPDNSTKELYIYAVMSFMQKESFDGDFSTGDLIPGLLQVLGAAGWGISHGDFGAGIRLLLAPIVKGVVKWLGELAWEALKAIGNFILHVADSLKNFMVNLFESAKLLVGAAIDKIGGALEAAKTKVVEVFESFKSKVAELAGRFTNAVRHTSQKILQEITGALQNLFQKLKDGVSSIVTGVKNAFIGAKDAIGSAWHDAVQYISSGRIVNDFCDWGKSVGNKALDFIGANVAPVITGITSGIAGGSANFGENLREWGNKQNAAPGGKIAPAEAEIKRIAELVRNADASVEALNLILSPWRAGIHTPEDMMEALDAMRSHVEEIVKNTGTMDWGVLAFANITEFIENIRSGMENWVSDLDAALRERLKLPKSGMTPILPKRFVLKALRNTSMRKGGAEAGRTAASGSGSTTVKVNFSDVSRAISKLRQVEQRIPSLQSKINRAISSLRDELDDEDISSGERAEIRRRISDLQEMSSLLKNGEIQRCMHYLQTVNDAFQNAESRISSNFRSLLV